MLKQVSGVMSTADVADILDNLGMFVSKKGYPWVGITVENFRILGREAENVIVLSKDCVEYQDITDDIRRISGKDRGFNQYFKDEGIFPRYL